MNDQLSKKVLVCGAGGFIGTHLVNNLKLQGLYVIGADLKLPQFSETTADEFYLIDLRNPVLVDNLITQDIDTIYQLAADMGGAGYIFTGDNDANIMHNSAQINLNIANEMVKKNIKNIFYTSSACVYPAYNQISVDNIKITEDSVYPANPDSEYGWEKLFSERMYLSYAKNYGLRVRIARLHNVYGPLGPWQGGKEKAPAALCRKVAETTTGTIDVWGSGQQTRSFLYIDECIKGINIIQNSNCNHPLNLGSDRTVSINKFVDLVASIANKKITVNYIDGPVGVNARTSNNNLIKQQINWEPDNNLEFGIEQTYDWIVSQIKTLKGK
jgi:nucleoside-diphosphate-sugar epimerase